MPSPSSSSGLFGDQEAQAIAYFKGRRVKLCGTMKDGKVSACEFEDWVDLSFLWRATQVINELTEENEDIKEEFLGISNTKDVDIEDLKEKYAHAERIAKYLYSQLGNKEQGERESTDAREEMSKKIFMLQKGISILSSILIFFAAGMMLLLKSIEWVNV